MRRSLLAFLAIACAHAPGLAPVLSSKAVGVAEGEQEQPQAAHVSPRAYSHYLDALLAKNADDLPAATQELREALQYDPDSPHLHTVLAEVLLRQGRLADAEQELETALKADPRHAPARLLRARIEASRGQLLEARDDLQAAIDGQPDDAEAYRDLARVLLSVGDSPAAEVVAERLSARLDDAQKRAREGRAEDVVAADRLRDSSTLLWTELGRWSAQHGMDETAQRAFAQARATSPSDPDALASEAAWLEAKRRFAEARDRYLRLLAQRPDAPEILAALARLSIADGDFDTTAAHSQKLLAMAAAIAPWDGKTGEGDEERRDLAAALFRVAVPLMGVHRSGEAQHVVEAALRLYPEHPELSFYRALALVQRGQPRAGALAFESVDKRLSGKKAAPINPAFLGLEPQALALDARVQAALALARAGEAPDAMRRVRTLFTRAPAEETVALALLEVFDRAGKAVEAQKLLVEAAREHPGADGLLYALGNAQDRLGERQKALTTMRQVIAIQPLHTGALNYIGYTLVERGGDEDLREAETLLSRAVDLRPDDGAIADSYGYCLLKLGRAKDALPELRRADQLAPRDPVILGHLGDALLASGRRDEAVAAFRRALSVLAAGGARHAAADGHGPIDPPDRPDREDAKVRAEIVKKLRSLSP